MIDYFIGRIINHKILIDIEITGDIISYNNDYIMHCKNYNISLKTQEFILRLGSRVNKDNMPVVTFDEYIDDITKQYEDNKLITICWLENLTTHEKCADIIQVFKTHRKKINISFD